MRWLCRRNDRHDRLAGCALLDGLDGAFDPAVRGADKISGRDQRRQTAMARLGHWSRHAGPAPGMLGCRASPELLAQSGLGTDAKKLNSRGVGTEKAEAAACA